jgi:hypothetical protein
MQRLVNPANFNFTSPHLFSLSSTLHHAKSKRSTICQAERDFVAGLINGAAKDRWSRQEFDAASPTRLGR